MPLAAAKLSKLALSKGGKFMLASVAALQPPTSFYANEYPSSVDSSLEFHWSPPGSGPAPDAYRFVFSSGITGTIEILGAGRVQGISSIPFNTYWTANVWSRLGEQESEFSNFLYGITSSAPYP